MSESEETRSVSYFTAVDNILNSLQQIRAANSRFRRYAHQNHPKTFTYSSIQPASLTPTRPVTGTSLVASIYSGLTSLRIHSFQNYTDYFKCIAAKGEDFAPCKQFKKAYNSLCPSEYSIHRPQPRLILSRSNRRMGTTICSPFSRLTNVLLQINKWDDQRDAGTFPASLEP